MISLLFSLVNALPFITLTLEKIWKASLINSSSLVKFSSTLSFKYKVFIKRDGEEESPGKPWAFKPIQNGFKSLLLVKLFK